MRESCDLIFRVGDFIKQERKNFDASHIEAKGKNDMVSYVDKTAEKMLVQGLRSILPISGFITEEETVKNSTKDFTWIIDPLDGTTNFIHGLPMFSISVALLHHSEIVMGLIYEINRNEMFSALKGKGSYVNDERIQVTPVSTLQDALIGTGFPVKNFDHLESYLQVIKTLVQNSHGIRRGGSAATDLAYVACGRIDAFFEYNLNPWDVAAGILMVREAGGTVTDFTGAPNALFGNQIIAAGGVFSELQALISSCWYG